MAKNIWASQNGQCAIDLDAVRLAAIGKRYADMKGNGEWVLRIDFTVEGFLETPLVRFSKDDEDAAEDAAQKDFNKIVAQWRGGAK